jgi:hypothetical protein
MRIRCDELIPPISVLGGCMPKPSRIDASLFGIFHLPSQPN